MTAFIIICILLLLAVVLVQIGKVSELSARIRGEEEVELRSNQTQGVWLLVFGPLFLIFCVASAWYYKNYMLGYGPHESASAHGGDLDNLFDITVLATGIVFIATQILLFYFAYKYRGRKGLKGTFLPHNNTLEVFWALIPAIVMTLLVAKGLVVWNNVMADVGEDEEYIEVEAMGYQFAWNLRYPGADGVLGTRDFRLIDNATNPVGQDWSDVKNLDDYHPSELVLPVNKKVRVRILARDVLHNFYLPHFRVKMDAVPGIPTYFIFTPTKTTEEYREELSNYPEYNVKKNPEDPDSPLLWEDFNYELACAELCGKGHYSMRRTVRIVTQEEYDKWESEQQSYYFSNIRDTDADPFKGKILDTELSEQRDNLRTEMESILNDTSANASKTIRLNNVSFETSSATLTDQSKFELSNLVQLLQENPTVRIEVAGHTDNTGTAEENLQLSSDRANAVKAYLVTEGISEERVRAVGFGDTAPLGSNDTEEGRAQNRRTEFRIINQ